MIPVDSGGGGGGGGRGVTTPLYLSGEFSWEFRILIVVITKYVKKIPQP